MPNPEAGAAVEPAPNPEVGAAVEPAPNPAGLEPKPEAAGEGEEEEGKPLAGLLPNPVAGVFEVPNPPADGVVAAGLLKPNPVEVEVAGAPEEKRPEGAAAGAAPRFGLDGVLPNPAGLFPKPPAALGVVLEPNPPAPVPNPPEGLSGLVIMPFAAGPGAEALAVAPKAGFPKEEVGAVDAAAAGLALNKPEGAGA